MRPKAIRLPQELLDTVHFAERKEKLDEPTIMRKFLRMGAERYVGDLYRRGEISLRDASRALGLTLRDTIELLMDMGVPGSVSASQAMKSLSVLKTSGRESGSDPDT